MGSKEREDEAELLAAAVSGRRSALERLLQGHGGRVYACALRMTGDAQLAEEITHDVFLAMLRAAGSFQGRASLGTWLYRITINRCLDLRLEQKRSEAHVAIDQLRLLRADEPATDALVEARERRERLDHVIAQLTPELRAVIVLRFAGGLRNNEIADTLQIAEGTVASRLHRALHRLAELLEQAGLTREIL